MNRARRQYITAMIDRLSPPRPSIIPIIAIVAACFVVSRPPSWWQRILGTWWRVPTTETVKGGRRDM